MAGYLLDTSVIIDTLNGKRDRKGLLERLLRQGHSLACCAINVAEVYAGMRPHEAETTGALLRSLDYYETSWQVAKEAGEIKFRHARRGRTLSIADTILAAVAINNGLTLITDKVRDFQIPALELLQLG
jgi:predicted nucleic acid-binding protein